MILLIIQKSKRVFCTSVKRDLILYDFCYEMTNEEARVVKAEKGLGKKIEGRTHLVLPG